MRLARDVHLKAMASKRVIGAIPDRPAMRFCHIVGMPETHRGDARPSRLHNVTRCLPLEGPFPDVSQSG